MTDWPPPPGRVLLAGVGGSGMRALAEFLRDLGWTVFGIDDAAHGLDAWATNIGVQMIDRLRLPDDLTLVVRSAAIAENDLSTADVPSVSYPELLAAISRATSTVAVAGTHGKTTVATLLSAAMGRSSKVVGGVSIEDGRSGRFTSGALPVVIEACEFRQHFLGLRPTAACILDIEWDHPDCFETPEHVAEAFREFIGGVEESGPLVVRDTTASLLRLTRPFTRFDDHPCDGYWPAGVIRDEEGVRFTLMRGDQLVFPMTIASLAPEFVVNGVAAAATALELGQTASEIQIGLSAYRGVERRFSVTFDREAIFVDDYAHHPTAIGQVLQSIRSRWPDRPVIAVFEPHQTGRLQAFEPEFAEVLKEADRVVIAPVFAAREQPAASTATQGLVNRIGSRAIACHDLDHVAASLDTQLTRTPHAVVAVLGAGQIGRILDERYSDRRLRSEQRDRTVHGHSAEGCPPRVGNMAPSRRASRVRR